MNSSRDSSSDSDAINPRIYFLGLSYRNIQLEHYQLKDTISDWLTSPSRTIFFNGVEAVDGEYNEDTIPIAIRIHLTNTDPTIVQYIEEYAHYNGFMHVSAKYTRDILLNQKIIIKPEESRFDFIENADGSVTCVESFYINYYKKLSAPNIQIKPEDYGRPIALVITESNIKVEHGQVKHRITSDKILLLDELGEKIFIDISHITDKRYQDSKAYVTSRLEIDIAQRVSKQQRQRQAEQQSVVEKKESQLSKVDITSKKFTDTKSSSATESTATAKSTPESTVTPSIATPDLDVLASELLADPDGFSIFSSRTKSLPKDSSEKTVSCNDEAADHARSQISEYEADGATSEAEENPVKRTHRQRGGCVII